MDVYKFVLEESVDTDIIYDFEKYNINEKIEYVYWPNNKEKFTKFYKIGGHFRNF